MRRLHQLFFLVSLALAATPILAQAGPGNGPGNPAGQQQDRLRDRDRDRLRTRDRLRSCEQGRVCTGDQRRERQRDRDRRGPRR